MSESRGRGTRGRAERELATIEDLEHHLEARAPDTGAVVAFVRATVDPAACIPVLKRALRRDPANVAARVGLVGASVRTGDRPTALREATSVLTHTETQDDVLAWLDPGDAEQVRKRAHERRTLTSRLEAERSEIAAGSALAAPLSRLRALARAAPGFAAAQVYHQTVCAERRLLVEARAMLAIARSGDVELSPGMLAASAQALFSCEAWTEGVGLAAELAILAPRNAQLAPLLDAVRARPEAASDLRQRLEHHLAAHPDPDLSTIARRLTPESDRGAPFLEKAQQFTEAGRPAEAAKAWMQWAETAPDHDRYLRAAQSAEALAEFGRAEFLYNHALRYHRESFSAQAGLARVKAKKADRQRESATDYRDLAERAAAAGDTNTAGALLLTWAEREATAPVLLDAAGRLHRIGRPDAASVLLKRAAQLSPGDPEVAAATAILTRSDPFDDRLAKLEERVRSGDKPGIAKDTREVLEQAKTLEQVRRIVQVVLPARLPPASWTPVGVEPASTFLRHLTGDATVEELIAAGVPEDQARTEVALSALREGRADSAVTAGAPEGSIVARVAAFMAAGMRLPRVNPADLETRVGLRLEALLADLPSVRRPSTTAPRPFRSAMVAGIEAFARGEHDAAVSRFSEAAALDERHAWEAFANIALAHLRGGRGAEASRFSVRAVRIAPRDPAARWVSAVAAVRAENLAYALEELTSLLEVDPAHRPARAARSLLLARMGRRRGATDAFMEGNENTVASLLRDDTLAGILVDLLTLDGRRVEAGQLLRSLGDALAGVALPDPIAPAPAKRSGPVIPDKPTGRWLEDLRQRAVEEGSVPAAIEALEEFTQRRRYVPAYLTLAQLQEVAGSPRAAVATLVRGRESVAPERRTELVTAELRLLEALGEPQSAFAAVQSLARGAWDDPRLRSAAVAVALADSSGPLGLLVARALQHSHPDDARAVIWRVLQTAGDSPGARDLAREIDPDLLKPVDVPHLRRQMQRLGSARQRLQLVQATLERAPSDPDLRRLHVDALAEAGETPTAIERATALASATDDPADHLRLADLLARSGHSDAEVEVYGRLLDRDPFDPEVHRRLLESGRPEYATFAQADPTLLRLASDYVRARSSSSRIRLRDALDAQLGAPSAEAVRTELHRREPHIPAWATDAPPRAPVAQVQPASGPGPWRPDPSQRLAVTTVAADARPAPTVEVRTALPQEKQQRGPDRRRIAYEAFKPRSQNSRFMYELFDAVAQQWWVDFRDELAAENPDPLDVVGKFWSRILSELARLQSPSTALILEAAWVARVHAHLLRRRSADRRRDRGGSGDPDRSRHERHLRLADELERHVVDPFLRAVAADSDPRPELLVEFALVVEHALPDPRREPGTRETSEARRELRAVMVSLRAVGSALEALGAATEKREHAERAIAADAQVRALGKAGPHVLSTVKDGLVRLRKALLQGLVAARNALDSAARVQVSWGTPRSDATGAFLVSLAYTNDGLATAKSLVLEMRVEGVRVELPAGPLPELAPGATSEVSVRVSGVPTGQRAIVVQGTLTYRATEALRGAESVAAVMVPPWVTPGPAPSRHLYSAGNPVRWNDPHYVERADPLRRIVGAVTAAGSHSPVLVYGLRRMGKTTLAYACESRLEATHAYAFLSLEDVRIKARRDGWFLGAVCKRIHEALGRRGIRTPEPVPARFQEEPFDATEDYLTAVTNCVGGWRVLLVLDEFQIIFQKIDANEFDAGMVAFFRSIIQRTTWLDVLVVGGDRLLDEVRNYEAPLFNLFLPIRVAYLEPDEARRLVTWPSREYYTWDDRAVQHVVDETRGHAWFLQGLCLATVERLRDRDTVTWLDVDEATEALLTAQYRGDHPELLGMLNAHPRDYRLVLAGLADLAGTQDRPGSSVPDLEAHLAAAGCPVADAASILLALEGMDLTRGHRQPNHSVLWEVAMPLLARWLRKYDHFSALVVQAADAQAEDAG